MANYTQHLRTQPQHQMVKDRDDQVQNYAGGFVYELSDMDQLDRFLIMGSDGGSYYASEKDLTVKSAGVVTRLIKAGKGRQVVDRAVEISEAGRAIKNDPALLVLALCLASDDTATRQYAALAVPKIARTGTHLFTLVDFTGAKDASNKPILRGWGRSLRRAIANWYNAQDVQRLAYQITKYQSRKKEGSQTWSHLDVLRKAHVRPVSTEHSLVLKYVTEGWADAQLEAFDPSEKNPFTIIYAHEMAKRAKHVDQIVSLIKKHGLVRESIPTQFLNEKKVWEALLENMPYTALIRNLATMTRVGILGPMMAGNATVAAMLRNGEGLRKARVHPITILGALKTYASGRSVRGSNTWTPVQQIVDALDDAFYAAFANVEPTGKRLLLAVDCSGSMDSAVHGMEFISNRDAAAAMALSIAKTEPNHYLTGFTSASSGQWSHYNFTGRNGRATAPIQDLGVSSKMRMDAVIAKMQQFPWGGTDCALPMLHAMQNNLKVDAFIIITDNETWDGTVKADEALRQYRAKSGIKDARLIVMGTATTSFTVGDPKDKYTLNVAGYDANVPTLVNTFVKGF